jgi:hypothetical protein
MMGVPILVLGRSGVGKTSGARNFKPGEALVISTIGKPLPFRAKLRQVNTRNYKQVCLEMRDAPEKVVILDDAGYLITGEFMDGHSAQRGGSSVFDLYNSIADNFWKLFRFIVEVVPPDKTVYVMMHVERADDGYFQPKTVGKLLNEKVDIPGMVTVCLFAEFADGQHVFHTRNREFTPAKCPPDMELADTMDNDLAAIDDAVRDYWSMPSREVTDDAQA